MNNLEFDAKTASEQWLLEQLSEAQAQIAMKDAENKSIAENAAHIAMNQSNYVGELQAQIAMQNDAAEKLLHKLALYHVGENLNEIFSLAADLLKSLSSTSETVAAWRAKETEPLRREVAMLEAAMKPAYCFYMIEVERVGWFSGKKEGRLHFTHSVEDAITFFDKHSAEIILNEFFGSAVSYMHPETYGRVLVTEHMWCNRPSNTQATALAYEREVENRGTVKALEYTNSLFIKWYVSEREVRLVCSSLDNRDKLASRLIGVDISAANKGEVK